MDITQVTVNIVELATNLAHNATKDELCHSPGFYLNGEDDELWVDDGNDGMKYTDEAQDVFDRWYDYFFGKIDECKQEDIKVGTILIAIDECKINGTNISTLIIGKEYPITNINDHMFCIDDEDEDAPEHWFEFNDYKDFLKIKVIDNERS